MLDRWLDRRSGHQTDIYVILNIQIATTWPTVTTYLLLVAKQPVSHPNPSSEPSSLASEPSSPRLVLRVSKSTNHPFIQRSVHLSVLAHMPLATTTIYYPTITNASASSFQMLLWQFTTFLLVVLGGADVTFPTIHLFAAAHKQCIAGIAGIARVLNAFRPQLNAAKTRFVAATSCICLVFRRCFVVNSCPNRPCEKVNCSNRER